MAELKDSNDSYLHLGPLETQKQKKNESYVFI